MEAENDGVCITDESDKKCVQSHGQNPHRLKHPFASGKRILKLILKTDNRK
jgi:hypothetical protein